MEDGTGKQEDKVYTGGGQIMDTFINNLLEFMCMVPFYMAGLFVLVGFGYVWTLFFYKGGDKK